MNHRYHPSSYDDSFCLKPPFLLWIALIYLSRAITLPFVVQISSLAGGSADTTAVIHGAFSVYELVPAVLAAVVLLALFRRSPSGSHWVRWIWARGRLLLATSAVLDVGLSLAARQSAGGWGNAVESHLLFIALDLYFLVYLLAAQRIRDVFAAFPAPIDRAAAGSNRSAR